MIAKNIIQRRDLEPMWNKAREIMRHYEKAADCISAVMGADCISAELSKHSKSTFFCSLCKQYKQSELNMESNEHPCDSMHRNAAMNARKLGGSYVYSCSLGFLFWTSSFFAGERFAGALFSGVAPAAAEKQQVIDNIFDLCKKDISRAEISHFLEDVPEKNSQQVDMLARLMFLCTEHLSSCGSELDSLSGGAKFWEYQPDIMERERQLLAGLRRGDSAEAKKTLRFLLNDLFIASGGNFDVFKYKIIELVVVLSRAGADQENNEELIESTNRYLKRLEELSSVDEVFESLCVIIERIAGKIFSFKGIRHASALRKAERFIRENFTRKISLKEIADVSGLSAPYFSTIFKEEMGENLSNYLNRIRIEKASAMLRETDFPIGEISSVCGFEDQSWFSKIFKLYTGASPCKYRGHGISDFYGEDFEEKKEII